MASERDSLIEAVILLLDHAGRYEPLMRATVADLKERISKEYAEDSTDAR